MNKYFNGFIRQIILLGTLLVSTPAVFSEQVMVTIADAKSSPAEWIDIGTVGNSLGDQYIFDQPLLNTSGEVIGSNSGVCIRTKLNYSQQCQWTLTLTDGTIQVAGREFDQGQSAIAIVGGTGRYKTIKGEMLSVKNNNGTFTQTLKF